MANKTLSEKISGVLFNQRVVVIGLFVAITALMVFFASQLRTDASFEKNIPLQHEYMQTYLEHGEEFGGANRILLAIEDTDGDIFNKEFFQALKEGTDLVSGISAVNQPQVTSLFTPGTRYIEAVEGGLDGGPVVYARFDGSEAALNQVRENILKAGIVGRLVANDFSSAMISGQLLSEDPATREATDFASVATQLEDIRTQIESKYPDTKVHIIGFSKMIGDVTEGAKQVLLFFLVAFVITALLVYWYSRSLRLTIFPLICSVTAVVWQLGTLTMIGYGLDPMSILVPFLVFAIGVSHGVQMMNGVGRNLAEGMSSIDAAKKAFEKLLVPGGIALLSDTIGFLTLLLINIDIIQELAVTASIGVAVIILTNLILLPVLLSFVDCDEQYRKKFVERAERQDQWWEKLSAFARQPRAKVTVAIALVLAALGFWQGQQLKIGDLHAGAPALRPDSVYNLDTKFITEKFSIGTDLLTVIVETVPDGCTYYDVMNAIDEFQWHVDNVEGVQSSISLASVSKIVNSKLNEGNINWKILPKDAPVLVQSISRIETSSGLLNADCSVIPILIFTEDHKAETIERLVAAIKSYTATNSADVLEARVSEEVSDEAAGTVGNPVKFRLATGPVGVMAATNEAVGEAQFPMLIWVYSAVILLCLISFRSVRGTICVVVPLMVVTLLAQALMTFLQIGLTVATLPVVALGVGIGVDYGIYIFSRMVEFIRAGDNASDAYLKTLRLTGNAVLFTGLTLAIGVSTWIFSPLQFQSDMGILLTFMFLVNMLGAVLLLPALAAFLYGRKK